MDGIKVNALMLRAADYGENDKILTLYSAERGRITAGIKGVKKAGAKLKFAAQPFCFAEYVLAERGGRYTVTQASECESFYDLRCDVGKYYAACSVCEAIIALTEEGDADEAAFSLAVRALTAMCRGDECRELISFLIEELKYCGYAISLGGCAECGAELTGADRLRFNMDGGSFTCYGCGTGAGVSGSTYNALRSAASLECDGERAESGRKRALKLLREYILYKTDAKLTSLTEYIDMIK